MTKLPTTVVLGMTVAFGLAVPCAARAAKKVPNPSLDRTDATDAAVLVQGRPIAFCPALITGAQCTNNWDIRAFSLQALAAIGRAASNAIPMVIGLTRDRSESVRLCAADALDRIGATSPGAVAALKTCLADETSDVRSVAAKALQKTERKAR